MKELEEKWRKFRLTDGEATDIVFDDEEDVVLKYKEGRSIVGKVCSSRAIGKEVLSSTLAKVWRISKAAKFLEVCHNTFVITFETEADKDRVWEGRPWLFDNRLLAMKKFDGLTPPQRMVFDSESFWVRMHNLPLACMNKGRGEQIGGTVGRVEKVETLEDGSAWGTFLRVQIRLNIMEPIPRGRTIKVKEESIWVPFSYEKLPKICFKCGCLMHGEEGCSMMEGSDQGEEQFGVWLRASQGMRGRFFNQNLYEGREERTEISREEGRGKKVREEGVWLEDRVFKNRGSQESEGGQDKQNNTQEKGLEVRESTGQRKERKEEGSVTNIDLGGVESESQVSLDLEVEQGGGRGVEKEQARRMEEEVGKQGGSITEMKNNKRGAWKRRARAKGGQEGEEEGVVNGNKRGLEGEVEAKQAEKVKRARSDVGKMGQENSIVVAVAGDQPCQSS